MLDEESRRLLVLGESKSARQAALQKQKKLLIFHLLQELRSAIHSVFRLPLARPACQFALGCMVIILVIQFLV